MKVPAILVPNSKIFLVGEAPGQTEVYQQRPFAGSSGALLDGILMDAHISRSSCSVSNVCKHRPPGNDISAFFIKSTAKKRVPGPEIEEGIQELKAELEKVKPNIVVALGGVALWALTGENSITDWRGSIMEATLVPGLKVIPTYHPAYILRQWSWRWIAVQDFKRVANEAFSPAIPTLESNYLVRPGFTDVVSWFAELLRQLTKGPVAISVDIETSHGQTTCIGLGYRLHEAICIPFRSHGLSYWTLDEEFAIVKNLKEILTHINAKVVGQNYLYDIQYNAREWGFLPNVSHDTMLAHHTLFCELPKALDFQASLYCKYYRFWKHEGKFDLIERFDEDVYWTYNCKDVDYTLEIYQRQLESLKSMGLEEPFKFQMRVFWLVLKMMLRGVRFDAELAKTLHSNIEDELKKRLKMAENLCGTPINPKSPKQLQTLFYEELGLKPVINRKTGSPTTDEEALIQCAKKQPLVRKLVGAINEYRALAASLNVIDIQIDDDSRVRCSYNVAGTVTYRLSSSQNPFGSGGNLQNISVGGKSPTTGLELPNLRRLFVPDPGMLIVEADLARADLQVVVWEAEDAELKQALRLGVDMHIYNALDLTGKSIPPLDELIETHPKYPEHKEKYKKERQFAKSWVHGTNYGGTPTTMARAANCSVAQSEALQKRWFAIHPGIRKWHTRVQEELSTKRFISNAWGYRRYFFSRIDNMLPEALAWIPQSTVAITINKGAVNLDDHYHSAEILLQTHDSITFQVPAYAELSTIKSILEVPIPYDDPLTIPIGFKTSLVSWGDCKEVRV